MALRDKSIRDRLIFLWAPFTVPFLLCRALPTLWYISLHDDQEENFRIEQRFRRVCKGLAASICDENCEEPRRSRD